MTETSAFMNRYYERMNKLLPILTWYYEIKRCKMTAKNDRGRQFDMLELSTFAKVDISKQSAAETDRSSDISDHEIANMEFLDYVFFLEEIEHR